MKIEIILTCLLLVASFGFADCGIYKESTVTVEKNNETGLCTAFSCFNGEIRYTSPRNCEGYVTYPTDFEYIREAEKETTKTLTCNNTIVLWTADPLAFNCETMKELFKGNFTYQLHINASWLGIVIPEKIENSTQAPAEEPKTYYACYDFDVPPCAAIHRNYTGKCLDISTGCNVIDFIDYHSQSSASCSDELEIDLLDPYAVYQFPSKCGDIKVKMKHLDVVIPAFGGHYNADWCTYGDFTCIVMHNLWIAFFVLIGYAAAIFYFCQILVVIFKRIYEIPGKWHERQHKKR